VDWIIVCTGPSAGTAPLELTRGRNVLAVNDAFRIVPWAQAMYACDHSWWECNDTSGFAGEKWTQLGEADARRAEYRRKVEERGLKWIAGVNEVGISRNPGLIHYNNHSGAQAMNLVFHWGARRIVLVGMDMRRMKKKLHYFGDHPEPLRNDLPFAVCIARLQKIAIDFRRLGVEVVNTSPSGALPFWEYKPLDACLGTDTRATALSA
jgi:hypothetical protein